MTGKYNLTNQLQKRKYRKPTVLHKKVGGGHILVVKSYKWIKHYYNVIRGAIGNECKVNK